MAKRSPTYQPKGMRQNVQEAFDRLADVKDRAELYGIAVDHRIIESGKQGRQTLYVFFEAESIRLVDYWAGNGTLRIGGNSGEKAKAESIEEALELARRELLRRVQQLR